MSLNHSPRPEDDLGAGGAHEAASKVNAPMRASALENGGAETRGALLRKAGIGGAALVGGGVLLGAGAGVARAGHDNPTAITDADVLNFALTLEYLEASFYVQALGSGSQTLPPGVPASGGKFKRGAITGAKELAGFGGRIRSTSYSYLSAIRDHEVTHVAFLRGALGAAAAPACSFDFSKGLTNVGTFLATARTLENTGVMAYDGAIRYVDAGDNLQAGAQIATVEARHAAYLNLITRKSPFPSAFDVGMKPSEIVAVVLATGFIKSPCPQPVLDLFAKFKANGA